MSRIYLAAMYSRMNEMLFYAEQLEFLGHNVQAEWITGVHNNTDPSQCAVVDFGEVRDADIVISFTEPPSEIPGRGRGGRHVEFGIALALGKRCIIVGHLENVFHHYPGIEFFSTFNELINALGEGC